MSKYSKRRFQVGDYFLGQRRGSPAWFRCRYNAATRQTERVSLETIDYEDAKRKLTVWFAGHGDGPMEQEPMLPEVLLGYYEAHGKNVVSLHAVTSGCKYWIEHFGNIPAKQASGHEPIQGFKAYLKRKGFADSYVNRVLSVGRAALTRAYERGLLQYPPIVKAIRGASGEAKGRPLELWELQHLLKGPDHLRRFVLLSLATGARPDAVLGLTWEQIDFTGGVIRLNPPGRAQSKKRRANIPMCSEIRKLLQSWGPSDDPVVHFRGKQLLRVSRPGTPLVRASQKMRTPTVSAIQSRDGCVPKAYRCGKWRRCSGTRCRVTT